MWQLDYSKNLQKYVLQICHFLIPEKIEHFKNIAIEEHSLKMELKFCTSNSHNLSHTPNLQLKLK